MQEHSEHYLFKFRLLLSDIFVAGCPDGNIHLLWKTPTAIFVYDQFSLRASQGYILINSDIEIEETLTKVFLDEFESIQTQLIVLNVDNQVKRPIASIKIDLAALAGAQILNCVKKFQMSSFIEDEAWISFSVSEVSSWKVMKEEAIDFGYMPNNQQIRQTNHIREVISHMNTQIHQQLPSLNPIDRSRKKKAQKIHKRFMTILEGKDEIIHQLQIKIHYLISNLMSYKNNKNSSLATSHRKSMIDTATRPTGRTFSTSSQTNKKSIRRKKRQLVQEQSDIQHHNIFQQNCYLKGRLQQMRSKQLELKETIMNLEKKNIGFQRQLSNKRQMQQELKQYRDGLYNERKKNILLSQENESLSMKVNKLLFKKSFIQHSVTPPTINEQRDLFLQIPQSYSRKITEMIQDKKFEVDYELKIRSSQLESQVIHLRHQVGTLKKKLMESQEQTEKIFDKESIGLQDKIKIKIQEYKNKLIQQVQKHSEQISMLQKDLQHTKLQATTAQRQNIYLQKQIQMLKSLHHKAEQRRQMSDSSIIRHQKYKRRCAQLQEMNRKLQIKIQKQEEQLKKRKETIVQLTQKTNEKQSEWNRLQRLQNDYQRQIEKLINMQSSQMSQRKLNVQLSNVQMKKYSIEDKIKQILLELKDLHISLDSLIKNDSGTQIQNVQKEIRAREELLRNRQQQLDLLESELLRRKSEMISSENSQQLDLIGVRLQQVGQENQELKSILKDLVKRTSMGVTEIDPKDNLMDIQIKEKQLVVKQQQFQCIIQEIISKMEESDNITLQSFRQFITKAKRTYGERLKQLKDQLIKTYHRQLDLCLRQKRVKNVQNKTQIIQVLRKLYTLLDSQPAGLNRRRGESFSDQPREQPIEYIKKQKDWELKLLQEKQKARLQKRKTQDVVQQYQSKLRNQRKNFNNELKQSLQKQKTHFISLYEKRLLDKQNQMNLLSQQISHHRIAHDQQQTTNVSYTRKLTSQLQNCNLKIKQIQSNTQEMQKTNKFYEACIKKLEAEVKNISIKLETKEIQFDRIFEEFYDFKEAAERTITDLNNQNSLLQQKSETEKNVLSNELERLKKIIEEAIMKEVSLDDQKLNLQKEIQYLKQSVIKQLSNCYEKKERQVANLVQEVNHEISKQKIYDEEYAGLLEQFQNQSKKLSKVKAQYASVQIMLSKAEEFIVELQETNRVQREIFQQKINQKSQKINQLNRQSNESMRGQIQKDLQYRSSVGEFELHIKRMEIDIEVLTKNVETMQKAQSQSLEQFNRKINQLVQQNNNLNEQLENYRQKDRKDLRKRVKKPSLETGKTSGKFPSNLNRSRISAMPSELNKSQLYSNDKDSYIPTTPNNEDQSPSKYDRRDSQHSYIQQPNSPKFNQSPGSEQQQFKLTVYDDQGRKGEAYELQSPTKQRKIQFPNTEYMQKPLDTLQNEENISQDREGEQRGSYQQLEQQIQKQKNQISGMRMQIQDKNKYIYDLENSKNLLQAEIEEVKKNIQISLKKRKVKLQYDDLKQMESYFDYYNRETVANIPVDRFRQIQLMTRQLNSLEQQFLKLEQKCGQYSSHIQEMNQEIQNLVKQNERISEQLRINEKVFQLQKMINQMEKQISRMNILVQNYQNALESNIQQREHSEKVIDHLQSDNNHLSKLIKTLQQTIQNMSEELNYKKEYIQSFALEKQELLSTIQLLNSQTEQLQNKYQTQMNSKNQVLTQKQKQLESIYAQHQERGKIIIQYQQEVNSHQKQLQQLRNRLVYFDERSEERNKKTEELLVQSSALTNTNAVLSLQMKQISHQKVQEQRKYKQEISEQQAVLARLREQIVELRKKNEEYEILSHKLKQQIDCKDINISQLKTDIDIFHKQNIKLNIDFQEKGQEITNIENHLKSMIQLSQTEISRLQLIVSQLKEALNSEKRINLELRGEISELQKMKNIQQAQVENLKNRHKQSNLSLQSQIDKLQKQNTQKMSLEKKQILEQFNINLENAFRETQQIKKQFEQYKKQIQIQRLQMFAKQRQFEDTKADYEEQKDDFMSKIQRYENEVGQIAFKLRDYQNTRPAVQMYEEILFQNQIFKNRIAQLQSNIVSCKDLDFDSQHHIQKVKNDKDRLKLISEIQHYSRQVCELQEKNYMLQLQIEEHRGSNLSYLQEQNQRLEKEVVRLEDSEQQLKREVALLRSKRQQQYRKLSAEIIGLKQRSKSRN